MVADVRKASATEYMKHKMNVVLEGGFFRGTRVKPYVRLASAKGYRLFIYQLEASPEVLSKRIAERTNNTEKKKVAKKTIKWNQDFHMENKYRGGEVIILDSEKLSPAKMANKILGDIKQ
jgi:hypothetical protein